MATTVVTNYAKGGPSEAPRRVNLKIDVEVGYDESPPHVKTVIRKIIEQNELILSDPEPVILFTQMMPSGLIFRINCWVEDYGDEWVARDQVQTAILRIFKEEDIEIPYPHMQLKYDAAVDEEEARLKKAEEKKAQEDKEKRQEEAREKDAEHEAKQAEERAVLRKQAVELRAQLENEELEDEERTKISTELMQIETRISGTDDD
jgi:flagellar biosynthesis GTPase FlhF